MTEQLFKKHRFKCVSPLDYRYYGGDDTIFDRLSPYLSEEANICYIFKVERALARSLSKRGLAPAELPGKIDLVTKEIDPEEVYEEDKRVHHYLKAAVNVLKAHLPESMREYIHLGATSFDVVDTANAARLRDCYLDAVRPAALAFETALIVLARKQKDTVQVGRTHGRFASPVTFGYFIAGYVDRFGKSVLKMDDAALNLAGKFSGAVGSYNALSLMVDDPAEVEREVLGDLGLEPAMHSTQIVQPEYAAYFGCSVAVSFGVLANLADDLRHLHRSEINEVYEPFGAAQVGSSTMPHKRNPWNLEHVKSQYKAFMPRVVTILLDQISEHQRDLTNSASGRYMPEMLVGYFDALSRMIWVVDGLDVNLSAIEKNLEAAMMEISSEPLYISLSLAGLDDAHEWVRKASHGRSPNETVFQTLERNEELREYFKKAPSKALEAARDPRTYTGLAKSRTADICDAWEKRMLSECGEGES